MTYCKTLSAIAVSLSMAAGANADSVQEAYPQLLSKLPKEHARLIASNVVMDVMQIGDRYEITAKLPLPFYTATEERLADPCMERKHNIEIPYVERPSITGNILEGLLVQSGYVIDYLAGRTYGKCYYGDRLSDDRYSGEKSFSTLYNQYTNDYCRQHNQLYSDAQLRANLERRKEQLGISDGNIAELSDQDIERDYALVFYEDVKEQFNYFFEMCGSEEADMDDAGQRRDFFAQQFKDFFFSEETRATQKNTLPELYKYYNSIQNRGWLPNE